MFLRIIYVVKTSKCMRYSSCHRVEKAHGPTGTRIQDPSQTVRAVQPTELPSHTVDLQRSPPPCINRFVPESAWNRADTGETVPLLLAARARTHTKPPNVTGEGKAYGPTGTRTQDPSQTVRALQLTELPSHAVDLRQFLPCDTRSPSTDPHWATKCHRGGNSTWPDRDSNPGHLAHHASTLANWATKPHGRPRHYVGWSLFNNGEY